MTGKTTLDERCINFVGGRVPLELQDELSELYKRGYRGTDFVKEGIRTIAAREGLMNRNTTIAHVETTVSGNG